MAKHSMGLSEIFNNTSGKDSKTGRLITIILPHLALYIIIFFYLLFGAIIFTKIEYHNDRQQQINKMHDILKIYYKTHNEARILCPGASEANPERFKKHIFDSLSKISSLMLGKDYTLQTDEGNLLEMLEPRWNRLSAVLYALSILTTTGYTQVTPSTSFGQLFSILYGLIGIPLMFFAAVDIGRFLSDCVLFAYPKFINIIRRIKKISGFEKDNNSNGKKINYGHSFCSSEIKTLAELKKSKTKKWLKAGNKKKRKFKNNDDNNKKRNEKSLPLSVNAAILLMFCTLGGIIYIVGGGSQKTFIEAFFVTFNLVANLTMSEMPTDISNVMTLIYIAFFVIFGLAVLSMCAELAATELKWLFWKIHYYGRKIKFKRKKQYLSHDEVKELLKIIEEVREKYPHKEIITTLDILEYIQEMKSEAFFNNGEIFISDRRRSTCAFMPTSFNALKFADENEIDGTTSESSLDYDETTANKYRDIIVKVPETYIATEL
uniref:Ion_trans_2 domain-containing protein n=1 Tax=Parastrongyloides trichosuri TaxID=131310 RepID=A0A0N4ZGD0_PARTI